MRRVAIKENDDLQACPQCGNKTSFVIHSNQVAEDLCEVSAVCICGFHPEDNFFEDVWGGCDDDNCIGAIAAWQDGVALLEGKGNS